MGHACELSTIQRSIPWTGLVLSVCHDFLTGMESEHLLNPESRSSSAPLLTVLCREPLSVHFSKCERGYRTVLSGVLLDRKQVVCISSEVGMYIRYWLALNFLQATRGSC